jgi:hypothetical protein
MFRIGDDDHAQLVRAQDAIPVEVEHLEIEPALFGCRLDRQPGDVLGARDLDLRCQRTNEPNPSPAELPLRYFAIIAQHAEVAGIGLLRRRDGGLAGLAEDEVLVILPVARELLRRRIVRLAHPDHQQRARSLDLVEAEAKVLGVEGAGVPRHGKYGSDQQKGHCMPEHALPVHRLDCAGSGAGYLMRLC